MRLDAGFYQRKDVVKIARELLGKCLFTHIGGEVTAGIIVETEAYSWKERGCHAYNGKRTARTEVMFGDGGHAYVYLCYGIHHLFNIVTNLPGTAEAVLVRALEPVEGAAIMARRRGLKSSGNALTSGPGKLTKAMGIDRTFNGKFLLDTEIWLENGITVPKKSIEASARIGIDYAGDDAALPWRFKTMSGWGQWLKD